MLTLHYPTVIIFDIQRTCIVYAYNKTNEMR